MTIFETHIEATPYYKIDRSEVMTKKKKTNKTKFKESRKIEESIKTLEKKERTNYTKQNLFRRKDRER